MPAGRPTSWSEEIEQQAWDYADGGWVKEGHTIPSHVGLCKIINVGKSTLYAWAKDPEKQFQDILAKIMASQEFELMDKGLLGDFNSNITKLALGKHGFHDKQDISGNDGGPIEVRKIERVIVDPENQDS